MPLRGLIGSDLLKVRPDWRVIDNPFQPGDPIVLLPAIRPDVALFHAPMADRNGNVWIGRRRELVTLAHAAAETLVTVDRIHDGDLLADETLAAGTLPALYVSRIAVAPDGTRPLPSATEPTDLAHIMEYARIARTEAGFAAYLDASSGRRGQHERHDPHRGAADRARRRADRPGSPCRGWLRFAIPAAAALLAASRAPGMRVSLLSSRKHSFFTDGGRELFDCAGQGRIDVFFLSGGQIDGQGNVNLVGLGDYTKPTLRFPGSFGSAYLYFVVPRIILFRVEHSRRTLVEQVDFISAPGTSPPGVYRPGGPVALVTGLCRFDFDRDRGGFTLASIHPGHTLEEVRDRTGFDFAPGAGSARDGPARSRHAGRDPRHRCARACRSVSPPSPPRSLE